MNTENNTKKNIQKNKIFGSVIAAAVMFALALIVYYFKIPNPNMILIAGLIVFASLYGYSAGIVSGLIMIIYSMFFFSEEHSFVFYTSVNLQKLLVIVIGVAVSVLFIGRLHKVKELHEKKLEEMNRTLRKENTTLEAATIFDALTGVRNRFSLLRDYENYLDGDIHAMILDVDDFKGINDSHGHALGDFVLRNIGNVMSDVFGREHSYRFGGDEFIVLYPKIEEENFLELTEELKIKVAEIKYEDNELGIHFSAGYVYGTASHQDDLRLMIRQADDCLYQAKRTGKDQCVGESYSREKALELNRLSGAAPINR